MLPNSILCVIKNNNSYSVDTFKKMIDRRRPKQMFEWITLGKMKEENQGLRLVK